MKFLTKYSEKKTFATPIVGESKTMQQFKQDCDLHAIVERCRRTGMPLPQRQGAFFGDFSELPTDLPSALACIKGASATFDQLPYDVRRRFNNDVGNLVAFVMDSNNRDEAIKLGLVKKPSETSQPVVEKPDLSKTETPKTETVAE